ncbi:MAG: helix-turn-helix domain-containing protein [Chloroflexota bacterium]|nr:helix-turn-helix domain-containing protein [Chloroflexota bacterium]
MANRHFSLTDVQAAELRQAYLRTKDGATRTRYQAVRLYGEGYPVTHISEITGCSRTSLLDWCRLYQHQGVPGLVDGRVGGNRATLTAVQRQHVHTCLHHDTPRQRFGPAAATATGEFGTVPDLKRAVHQWFGVTWNSRSSYLALLAECEFSYQRTQKVFKSRREREIMAFEESLEKN